MLVILLVLFQAIAILLQCVIQKRSTSCCYKKKSVPLINAGDGGHNHPTQTLTDLLTIYREKGRLDNLTIGFCGDLKFGRTVHSLTKAMSRYKNIKFVFIAPPELKIPEYLKHDLLDAKNLDYKEVETIEEVIGDFRYSLYDACSKRKIL